MPSDRRASTTGGRSPLERLGERLREMFEAASQRPMPPELLDLVDQLENGPTPEASCALPSDDRNGVVGVLPTGPTVGTP